MSPPVLRPVGGRPGTRLAALLGQGLEPVAPDRPVTGCLPLIVAAVADEGSPTEDREGAAAAELAAVRLRESGSELDWGAPVTLSLRGLLRFCRERGADSVPAAREEPGLLRAMQLGSWFDAPWRTRALRRVPGASILLAPLALISRRWLFAAADLAFWSGARDAAEPGEWRRLTRSSYAVLLYHRFAGEAKPDQERLDLSPRRFRRQLLALRIAGFRPLSGEHLLDFHAGSGDLPRRGVVITVDDATADSVAPLLRARSWCPQLFAPTAEVGGRADWLDGEPVASWDELRSLTAAGARIGSHGRRHRRFTELDAAARGEALRGSLEDLRREVGEPFPAVAFPNGAHDARLCREAEEAGYRLAYTTEKGRNGAGTDAHCLKRVSVHRADGALAILWKASTGAALPARWMRLRERRARARGR